MSTEEDGLKKNFMWHVNSELESNEFMDEVMAALNAHDMGRSYFFTVGVL